MSIETAAVTEILQNDYMKGGREYKKREILKKM